MTREEAIKNIKRLIGFSDTLDESIFTLFPEPAESEDEKIRKAIIEFFELQDDNTTFSFVPKKDILAYLEKQKPTSVIEILARAGLKPYKDGNQWCILAGNNIQEGICGFGDTIEDALYEFLKEVLDLQKEQEPVEDWKEKRKKECPFRRNLDNNLYGCERYAGLISECNGICSWVVDYPKLKEIQDKKEQKSYEPKNWPADKNNLTQEQKPEWSEEDKALFELLHQCICRCINDDRMIYSERERISKTMIPFIEKLQALHPQSKVKWSEEDEKMLQRIIRHTESEYQDWCNDKYGNSEIVSDGKRSCLERLDWLEKRFKSLQPQAKQEQKEQQSEIKLTRWVARDENGEIYAFEDYPEKDSEMWIGSNSMELDQESFPNIKWETGPVEVEVTIKKKNAEL